MSTLPSVGRQLRSLVSQDGRLELFLEEVEVAPPQEDEVLVRVIDIDKRSGKIRLSRKEALEATL